MPAVPMPKLTLEPQPIHPILGAGNGPYSYAILGEAGGLTQFGAHIEVLPPGSRSSFRHWHQAEDEMILMLEGEVILIEETETLLRAGDVATWAKAVPTGHCLENRSAADARYLTVGARLAQDVIHYPNHDLIAHKDNTSRRYTHADGRPRATDW